MAVSLLNSSFLPASQAREPFVSYCDRHHQFEQHSLEGLHPDFWELLRDLDFRGLSTGCHLSDERIVRTMSVLNEPFSFVPKALTCLTFSELKTLLSAEKMSPRALLRLLIRCNSSTRNDVIQMIAPRVHREVLEGLLEEPEKHGLSNHQQLLLIKIFVVSLSSSLFANNPMQVNWLTLIEPLTEFHQRRSLIWLKNTLQRFASLEPSILAHRVVPKMIAAAMLLRHPTLRERIGNAFFYLLHEKQMCALIENEEELERSLFQSKFLQPLKRVVNDGSFLQEMRKMRKTPWQLKEIPDLSELAPVQIEEVEKLYQGYQDYRRLLFPESFESQLLDPILKRLPKGLLPSFKRELCSFVGREVEFSIRLGCVEDSITRAEMDEIFRKYRDVPPKYNFQFIALFCGVLESQGCDPEILNRLQRAVHRTFDIYYFPLLKVLDKLSEFPTYTQWFSPLPSVSVDEKNAFLKKLCALFANGTKTAGDVQRAKKELSSLMSLFLFNHMDPFSEIPFSEQAERAIREKFLLPQQGDLIVKFENLFLCERMQGLFPQFVAAQDEEEGLPLVREAVRSVLDGTYEEKRYATSLQCQKLKGQDPLKYEQWKTIRYDALFSSLSVKTSIAPLDILLSGTENVMSCQALYNDGHATLRLIGLFDGRFLPLFIKQEDDTNLARAHLVLYHDENDAPILLLEKYYGNNRDPQLRRRIEGAAKRIAEEMQWPLISNNRCDDYSPGPLYTGTLKFEGNTWGPESPDAFGGDVESSYVKGPCTFLCDPSRNLQVLYHPSLDFQGVTFKAAYRF